MVVYWTFGSVFIVMDLFKWPKWSQKYKVQPGTNEDFDLKALLPVIFFHSLMQCILISLLIFEKKLVRRVVLNQIFCNIPVMTATYFIRKSRGLPDIATLPTLNKVYKFMILKFE